MIVEALWTTSATNVAEQVTVDNEQIRLDECGMSSHFTARFGRMQTADRAAVRETAIRLAHNSQSGPYQWTALSEAALAARSDG